MKAIDQVKSNFILKHIKAGILFYALFFFWLGMHAQQNLSVRVANDREFLEATENPAVTSIIFETGYYASIGRNLGPGIKAYKSENGNGGRSLSCIYAIQESEKCFNPAPPETFLCDSARIYLFDPFNCGCCPPENSGTWSYTSGPGNVTFSSPTNQKTEFCVDAPGAYLLKYSWPAPWNSSAQTEYYFYDPYVATLEADDTCSLSTMVHFEYSTGYGDPGATLVWTLNGIPYTGPAMNPEGDEVDFLLTVPYCGYWTLEATIIAVQCDPVVVSVTVNLKGENGPIISGVGTNMTIICPETAVFSDPAVYDPCDPDPVMTYVTETIPGDCPGEYTMIRTWTAVNSCGLISLASQTIIHLPDTTPEILTEFLPDGLGEDIYADCEEEVILPFPVIITACGQAITAYSRSDGGAWADPFDPGTTTEVCFWGVTTCGYSTDTICFLVVIESCDGDDGQFCTLTQGAYGTPGGTYCNGMGTAELIDFLLAEGNLVVGYNNNTMTFYPGQSGCIIDLLPGGGPAKKITGANNCCYHPGIQMKYGRIHNILLAQTITLGLNLRLDTGLANLEIFSNKLLTAPSSGCGGQGDTITGPYSTDYIPLSVYNVLSNYGTTVPTVYDLYVLANKGLGGCWVGFTTLTSISCAVSKINEGFDECAFGYFDPDPCYQSMEIPSEDISNSGESSLDLQIFPNPFNTSTNIEFITPEDGHTCVEIYSLTGVKVATIYDDFAEAGNIYRYTFSGDLSTRQVTYICRIRTDNETKYERIVMIR